ncbi:hypothetical protein V3C99_000805 [Haemonchus contortus]|uniref:Transcriptional regulator n=1 Tax=Haemonchus contortus TaxID=6289 RepID=A0A7I5E9K2_HAECO
MRLVRLRTILYLKDHAKQRLLRTEEPSRSIDRNSRRGIRKMAKELKTSRQFIERLVIYEIRECHGFTEKMPGRPCADRCRRVPGDLLRREAIHCRDSGECPK